MGVIGVRVFLSAVVFVIVVAVVSQLVLTRFVGESSERAYSEASTRTE